MPFPEPRVRPTTAALWSTAFVVAFLLALGCIAGYVFLVLDQRPRV